MQKPKFVDGHVYHIYNRGVEKRKTFLNDRDYLRFIHDLFEFNDLDPVLNVLYYFNSNSKYMEVEPPYIGKDRKKRKLLVEILAFALMPNHYHLLLRQKREGGIVQFMQKLGTGYTMYFNQKYQRVGGLFQGRYKAVLVNREAHFLHLPFYIHTNPLELKKYGGSTSIDWKIALKFLEEYRWSSFSDYIGKKNFPSVTSRNFLLKFWGGEKEYKKETIELLKKWNDSILWEGIEDVVLEETK